MKCFQCAKGTMHAHISKVSGEVRGEPFTVETEAMVCDRCGFQVLTEEQSAGYTAAISDAYRRKHGLLTSEELREARKRLGFSQVQFAKYLKVGVASVKRWEAGLIQDEALDELIRLKTDLGSAWRNVRSLEAALLVQQRPSPWGLATVHHPGSSEAWLWIQGCFPEVSDFA